MACARIFTGVCAVLVALAFGGVLSPTVVWSQENGTDLNLWKTCTDGNCIAYGEPQPNSFFSSDAHKSLRNGTIAACVFSVLFSLTTSLLVCCHRKIGAVLMSFLTAICATAALGAWVEYMQHSGSAWGLSPKEAYQTAGPGVAVVATGFVIAWLTLFASFCIGKRDYDQYGQLA